MDKFLETYNLPRLNQEKIGNLNRPIISSKIEFVVKKKKKLPANKSPGLDDFRGEFYQTYKKELTPILFKLFQKVEEHEALPNLFWGHYLDIKSRKKKNNTKKKKITRQYFNEYRCKIINKILTNRIQQYIKRINLCEYRRVTTRT